MFEQNVTLGPGTGTFSQHTFEILIMLFGAFLIGLWLGWALWAKYKQQIDKMALENQSLNVTSEALRGELNTIKTRLAAVENEGNNLNNESDSLNSENGNLREKISILETQLASALANNRQLDTELGLTHAPDITVKEDIPLEVMPSMIEMTEELTVEPEVVMAETTPAPFVIEPVAITEPQPEKKKSPPKKAASDKTETITAAAGDTTDDLTVIEGIGPKLQMLLNQYGIFSYRQLAETEVERLKEILSTAGPQLAMHDPGTWPSQANLAANDQWDTLKSVQGFLKGGKKPT